MLLGKLSDLGFPCVELLGQLSPDNHELVQFIAGAEEVVNALHLPIRPLQWQAIGIYGRRGDKDSL